MNFNDMLLSKDIDPERVVVFRHRPTTREFRRALPWMLTERPELFNAYQQTQSYVRREKVLKSLVGKGYVASFIGHEPGRAVYVGLYGIDSSKPLTPDEFQQDSAYQELTNYGWSFWFTEQHVQEGRPTVEWFDLNLTDFYSHWKGKLVIDWPPPERSWWRRAHKNNLSIYSVREESAFNKQMEEWNELVISWKELKIIPRRWKHIISQWRGIYFIFDQSDGKGYVGSAYGENNILGRWETYGATGHGGNKLLRKRDPENFLFSVLERVSPDLDAAEVINLETGWKKRLNTHAPHGLNDN